MVPDRPAPVVAATLYCTVAVPDPLAPVVIVIQSAWLAAVHVHPASVVTVTLPVPPVDPNPWVSGLIANAHPCACVTVTVCPAIVTVPDRPLPVDGAICSVTVPLPFPDEAPMMLIQGALLAADHAQPDEPPTVIVTSPPAAGAEWVEGVTWYEQPVDWVTRNG
jgi:hypothetical protein